MFTQIIILGLCLVVDVTLVVRVGGVPVRPHLTTLFLIYMGMRRPFAEVVLILLIFILMSHPFTGLNYVLLFVSYVIVLFVVNRLRGSFFAEAYLTHAFWVLLFSAALQALLELGVYGVQGGFVVLLDGISSLVLNSAAAALVTVPFFIGLDNIWDRRRERVREDLFG